jgi:predicted phage terminase large subunit-like protein
MLDMPGSIWHEAVGMYTSLFPKIKIRHREHEVIFHNGSVLKFSHMQYESNAFDHKGAQYSFVAFDEATDFTEMQVMFLLSRMRNANVQYTPQMYLCTNPNYYSFIREWIQDFYLDPVDGTPISEKSNKERFFVRNGNEMKWFDDRSEAEAIYGTGKSSGIRSFRFCSAKIWDNPYLRDSDYLSNLKAMSRVEQLIFLEGSWTARAETSGYWHRTHISIIDYPPEKVTKRVLAVDFAFTKPSETVKSPDSTAFVLMSKDEQGVYTVEYVYTMQDTVHVVENKLFELAKQFGQDTIISIPIDPNAQAGAYARGLQKRLAEMGHTCKCQKPVKSKLVRFQPFAAVTEARFVRVVAGDWNKHYFDQLEIFDGLGKHHDDMVDATSDAFFLLNKSYKLPELSLHAPNYAPVGKLSYNNTITSVAHTFNNTNGSLNIHNN